MRNRVKLSAALWAVTLIVASACAPRARQSTGGVEQDRVAVELETLRSATSRFHELDSAVAAGYPRAVQECLVHEHHGAMGYHHVNRAYLSRDMDVSRPQILLYERMPDSSYRLNAVEFILPYRLWPRDSIAPVVMGQSLHQEDNLKIWYLHVWAWRNNPGGVFANFHPDVRCPAASSKVYVPFP
jgi:hypothetical protein